MNDIVTVLQRIYNILFGRKYIWLNYQVKFPQVDIPKGGSAYLFDNSNGSVDVMVNNYNLGVGRSLSLGGDQNEIDGSTYKISYPSGTGSLDIWYKVYVA